MSDTQVAPVAAIPFTVASRPQRRFSATQTVSNLTANSFQPILLPATGFVRKIALYFSVTGTCASAGAVVAGDGPWNLLSGITLTDATGQPIVQPVSGYNLYLINKYLPSGIECPATGFNAFQNPHIGPEYAYSATATSFTAKFRLDIDLEQDSSTGYGCVPNLDSNASLQLKIDVAAITAAFSGTTISASTISVTVDQWYWAPLAPTMGKTPVQATPPGFGDYLETRYETQAVNAGSENTIPVNARGGLIKGYIAVSRNAGVRTAFAAGSNVGLLFDNNAIDEGVRLEAQQDYLRRVYGYYGADVGTSYAPVTAGTVPGLDTGVLVWNFGSFAGRRDTWLSTRVGSMVQFKVTPGASATQFEILTQLAQVRDPAAFFGRD